MSEDDNMWENMVIPKIMNDVDEFWKKYREEHGIGKNIVLLVMDIDRSLTPELGRVMNLFIDEVIRQREYEGRSALQPEEEERKDEEECSHIGIVMCDEGYDTSEERRDIGLKCEDCGQEWDVHFKRGKQGVSIKPRLILDKVLDKALGKSWESLEP